MVTTTMVRTDKKERIVAAAEKLWRQAHRVSKVSLADVAREAGVSPTTIYNYFTTREGLVHEVVTHLMSEVLEKQKAVIKMDMPFPQKMQAMISAKMGPIKGMETDLIDKLCTDRYSKEYVEKIAETEFQPLMRAIIAEGKRDGYIRPDMPDEVVMLYFEVLKSGGVTCSEEMKRIVVDKDMMLAFTRLIYFGIFQKEFEISLDGAEKKS